MFRKTETKIIEASIDADQAGDVSDIKSLTGYYMKSMGKSCDMEKWKTVWPKRCRSKVSWIILGVVWSSVAATIDERPEDEQQ